MTAANYKEDRGREMIQLIAANITVEKEFGSHSFRNNIDSPACLLRSQVSAQDT